MVERFNLVMGSMHERLERMERHGVDGERHRVDQDENHARRYKRHVNMVVDIDFD